jgi:hypothetical protein
VRILPIIHTHPPDEPYLRQLLSRYPLVSEVFLRPIFQIDVLKDGISEDYDRLLKSVSPQLISCHEHDYSKGVAWNVCNTGMEALRTALTIKADLYLFLEGDIVISRKICGLIKDIVIPDNLGLLTFYTPGDEYPSDTPNRYPIYKFQGDRFYGLQCILLSKEVVRELSEHQNELDAIPGYNDMRWKEYLLQTGRDFYASHKSYAQHIGFDKTHKLPTPPHSSRAWVEDSISIIK